MTYVFMVALLSMAAGMRDVSGFSFSSQNTRIGSSHDRNNMGLLFAYPPQADQEDLEWESMYQQILEVKQERERDGPKEFDPEFLDRMNSWIEQQRTLYQKDMLSATRIQKLSDTLGIPLDPAKSKMEESDRMEALFDVNFEKLVEYQAQYGHCNVPFPYEPDPVFGVQVESWRIFQVKAKLVKSARLDRWVEQLKAIGFRFYKDRDEYLKVWKTRLDSQSPPED